MNQQFSDFFQNLFAPLNITENPKSLSLCIFVFTVLEIKNKKTYKFVLLSLKVTINLLHVTLHKN